MPNQGLVESWDSSKDTYIIRAANGGDRILVSGKALNANTNRQNGTCVLQPGDEVLYNENDIQNRTEGKCIYKAGAVSLLAWGGGRGHEDHAQRPQGYPGSDQRKPRTPAQAPSEEILDPVKLTRNEKREINKDRSRRGERKRRLREGTSPSDSSSVFLTAAAEGVGCTESSEANEVERSDAQIAVENHKLLAANGMLKDPASLPGENFDFDDEDDQEPLSFEAVLEIVKRELKEYDEGKNRQVELDNNDHEFLNELMKTTAEEGCALAGQIIAQTKLNVKKGKQMNSIKIGDITKLCNLLRSLTLPANILLDCLTALYSILHKNTFVGVPAANARGAIPLCVQAVAKHNQNHEIVTKGFELLFTLLTSPPASKRHLDSTAKRTELTVAVKNTNLQLAVDRQAFRAGKEVPLIDVAHKSSIDEAVRLGALDVCMQCLQNDRVKTDVHYLSTCHNFLMRVTSVPKYYFNIAKMGGLDILSDISDLPILEKPAQSFLRTQVDGMNRECVEVVLTGNQKFIPNKPLANGPAIKADPNNKNRITCSGFPDSRSQRKSLPDEQKRKCITDVIQFGAKYPEYGLKYVTLEESFLDVLMEEEESKMEDFMIKIAEYPALSQCFMDFMDFGQDVCKSIGDNAETRKTPEKDVRKQAPASFESQVLIEEL